jgi:hypothetical protein
LAWLKSIGQKIQNFYSFYVFFHECSPFWRLFGEFPRKLMSCWRSYCAVGVPADATIVVAALPSAVDIVLFLLSQLLWPPSMLLPASLFFARIPAFDSVHTVLPVLLLLSFLLLLAFLLFLSNMLLLAVLLLLAFLLLTAFLLLLASLLILVSLF